MIRKMVPFFFLLLISCSTDAAFYQDHYYSNFPVGRKYPSLKSVKGLFTSLTKSMQTMIISLFPSIKTDIAMRNTVIRSSYLLSVGLFGTGVIMGCKSWNEVVRQLREFEEQGIVGKNMRQLPRLF